MKKDDIEIIKCFIEQQFFGDECPFDGNGVASIYIGIKDLEAIINVTDYAIKYAWHKKPETGWTEETLPEKNKLILFETSKECFLGDRFNNSKFYSYSDKRILEYDKDIIECWKYYEPYEGEEE